MTPSIVPDGGQHFKVRYDRSIFSDDSLLVETDNNQLLTSATIETNDQSGAILVELAKLLATAARLASGISPQVQTFSGAPVTIPLATLYFDPTNKDDVDRVTTLLAGKFIMSVNPSPEAVTIPPACNHTLCYRPLVPVTVRFQTKQGGNIDEFLVNAPDPHRLVGVDIERSSFVTRKTVLLFENGSLTKYDLNKPSELLAGVKVPLEIFEAVISALTNTVTKVLGVSQNEVEQQTALINAQSTLLSAISGLVANQKKLNDATNSAGGGDTDTIGPDG